MTMHPHSVRIGFEIEPTALTDEQAKQLLLIGRDFTRVGHGLYTWTAECDAHTIVHALEWAESRIRSVVGEAIQLKMLEAKIARLGS
jgi:hypothetical protein